jgi:hypothetical protein
MKLWAGILPGLMLVFYASNCAQAWTTPVNISNAPEYSSDGSLVVDQQGHLHVTWSDGTDWTAWDFEVLYCFYDGDYWSVPVNISNDLTNSREPDIIIDASGQPHVAWTDWNTGEIFWTFYDGVSWSSPMDIRDYVGFSVSPSLAADNSGRVFIAWHDLADQSDIHFSIYDGISWSTPHNLTDDPEGSAYPDIVVDSKGHVHLVWMDYADVDIHYSQYDGESWTGAVNVSQLTGQSCSPKITLDPQDHPHVVWEQHQAGYHVFYTCYYGQEWTVPYKVSVEEKSLNPTIAIDSRNRIYITWSYKIGEDKKLHWRSYDTSWSDIFSVPSTPGRAAAPQIVIDMRDSLHVIFSADAEENRDIFYTRRNATGLEEWPERLLPQKYNLEQNYPNPFNQATTIRYTLSGCDLEKVTLRVYNLLGKEVITLIDQEQIPGRYEISWDGRDKNGDEVCSGIYFYRLQFSGFGSVRKMVLLR